MRRIGSAGLKGVEWGTLPSDVSRGDRDRDHAQRQSTVQVPVRGLGEAGPRAGRDATRRRTMGPRGAGTRSVFFASRMRMSLGGHDVTSMMSNRSHDVPSREFTLVFTHT